MKSDQFEQVITLSLITLSGFHYTGFWARSLSIPVLKKYLLDFNICKQIGVFPMINYKVKFFNLKTAAL